MTFQLKTKVQSLETLIYAHSSKIADIETFDNSNKEAVDELEWRVDGLETSNTTINNSLEILNTKINVLENDITSNLAETDTDRDYDVVFAEGSGDKNLNIGSNPNFTLKFNPNSGTLRVPTIIGNVSYASNANYSNFATNLQIALILQIV